MSIYDDIARDTLSIGGGTWARDAYRHVVLPNRYVVALGEPWTRVISSANGTMDDYPGYDELTMPWDTAEALRELANLTEPWQTAAAFNPNPKALGTWVDPSTNNVHVDIVESLVHRGYALRTARERGQLSIFDQWTWKAIDVPSDLEYVS